VSVAHFVERVVVVLEEVPAADVVDVAVRVGIDAVGEEEDQVPGSTIPLPFWSLTRLSAACVPSAR
jgi:hypothetical protein